MRCAYVIHNGPIPAVIQGEFRYPNPFHLCAGVKLAIINEEKGVITILRHPYYNSEVRGRVAVVDRKYLSSDYIKEEEDVPSKAYDFVPIPGIFYTFDGKGTAYENYRLNGTTLKCLSVHFDQSATFLGAVFEIVDQRKKRKKVFLNRDKIFWAIHLSRQPEIPK